MLNYQMVDKHGEELEKPSDHVIWIVFSRFSWASLGSFFLFGYHVNVQPLESVMKIQRGSTNYIHRWTAWTAGMPNSKTVFTKWCPSRQVDQQPVVGGCLQVRFLSSGMVIFLSRVYGGCFCSWMDLRSKVYGNVGHHMAGCLPKMSDMCVI